MCASLDQIGGILVDASLAAALLLSLVALVMVGCRQPARRVGLARLAILASLGLIPLSWTAPLPRVQVPRWLEDESIRSHPAFSAPRSIAEAAGPAWAQDPAFVVSSGLGERLSRLTSG